MGLFLGPPNLSSLPDRIRLHGVAGTFVYNIPDTHVETKKANLEAFVVKYKDASDIHRRCLVFEVGDLVWVVY